MPDGTGSESHSLPQRLEARPLKRARPLLGTLVEIRCQGDEPALTAAFAAIALVHRLMSFHEGDSELTRLNCDAALAPVTVHPWTWKVLGACRRLYQASAGRFDPAIAPHLVRAGLLPAPSDAWPDPQASFADVQFLAGRRVRFRRPLWLDLGGIAKGFAVDAAIATLRAHGVRAGVVNAGGDLRVLGPNPERIVVRDPDEPTRLIDAGLLSNGACATSGDYFSPRPGESPIRVATDGRACAVRSVTVFAPRCLWADALTKLVALQPQSCAPLLRQFSARLAAGMPA